MTCPECGEPGEVVDDNGVTDPSEGVRRETWECSNGHQWTNTLV